MLIKALCDYYDILAAGGNVLPDGYSKVKIHYLVELTQEGNIESIVGCQTKEEIVSKSGKVKVIYAPREEMMFRRVEVSGICSNVIEQRPMYIFGLNYTDNGFEVDDRTDKAKKSHADFVRKNLDFIDGINTPVVNAYRKFLENWTPENETDNEQLKSIGKAYSSSGFAFCLASNPFETLLHNDEMLKAKWEKMLEENGENENAVIAQCGITGELAPIARVHNKIKGIMDGNSTGTVLVGFKGSAMSSYGNEQAYNSNISEAAMKKYTEALNYLLADKKHTTILDEVTVVHWAMSKDPKYNELCSFLMMGDGGVSAEQADSAVKSAIEGVRNGRMTVETEDGKLDLNIDFYIVGIKPNSSRLSVKFIYKKSFGNLLENVIQHRDDMRIRQGGRDASLWNIKNELVSPKSSKEKTDPALMSKLLEAVMYGTNYPPYLLSTLVRRVKTDSNDDKNQFIKMNDVRVGMIKACINRKARLSGQKEEIKMALDTENNTPAYLCGRLFAVLEKVQQDASGGGLNRTIKDAYFASATSRPALIFPNLLKLAQNHISKTGYDIYWNNYIGEIVGKLDGEFPQTLTLTEQGVFIIGYYQQNQKLYEKKSTDNTK